MHKNPPFSYQKSKNFLGREHSPLPQWGGGTPPLKTPSPLGASCPPPLPSGANTTLSTMYTCHKQEKPIKRPTAQQLQFATLH